MEKENCSIYNKETQLLSVLESLPESVGKENTKTVKDFIESYSAENQISSARKLRLIQCLKHVSKLVENKPLLEFDENDLKRLSLNEQEAHYSDMAGTRGILKQFFRTMGQKKYFELLQSKFLSGRGLKNEKKFVDPDRFWSEQEQKQYLRVAELDSAEYACFGALLFTSGARIGEIATLQRKNVEINDNGVILFVSGKTGERSIALHTGIKSYVVKHFETLPKEPDTFLFAGETLKKVGKVNQWERNYSKPLSYTSLSLRHKGIMKKAGIPITKYANFHGLRKQHATWCYKNLGERMAEQRLGHMIGSKVAKHYSGLTHQDANQAYLEKLGIVKVDKDIPKAFLESNPCPLCNKVYAPTQEFCPTCCFPLGGDKKAILMESVHKLAFQLSEWKFHEKMEQEKNALKT